MGAGRQGRSLLSLNDESVIIKLPLWIPRRIGAILKLLGWPLGTVF